MSNKQLRTYLRYGHIAAAFLIGPFIYSTSLQDVDAYALFVQLVVFPSMGFSGILMWQQARISKWRKNRSATVVSTGTNEA